MIPRVWLINIVLVLCAAFAGKGVYSVWIQEERTKLEVPAGIKNRPAVERQKRSGPVPLVESSYNVIADRNLFSPDRAEYIQPEPVKESEQPQFSEKNINLYGVIIMENTRSALIDNPNRKPEDPPNKWVSVGDTLGNLTVSAIEPESIILKEGGKKYQIPLYKKGEKPSSSTGPDRSKPAASPTVVYTEPQKSSSVTKKATPEANEKKKDDGTEEYKTINTPFGPVKRRSN